MWLDVFSMQVLQFLYGIECQPWKCIIIQRGERDGDSILYFGQCLHMFYMKSGMQTLVRQYVYNIQNHIIRRPQFTCFFQWELIQVFPNIVALPLVD